MCENHYTIGLCRVKVEETYVISSCIRISGQCILMTSARPYSRFALGVRSSSIDQVLVRLGGDRVGGRGRGCWGIMNLLMIHYRKLVT